MIDAHTRFIALIGMPVGHSLSPRIHNAALKAQGLNVCYGAFAVAPEDLAAAVDGLRALRFLGANVTLPHKEGVLALVDELTPEARAVGAVNTIVRQEKEGRLLGDNTDVEGFFSPLAHLRPELNGEPVALLGAGGAARAVLFGVVSRLHPSEVAVVARSPERAERMVDEVLRDTPSGGIVRVVPELEAGPIIRHARLVVNATPVGMHPDAARSPWHAAADFHDGQIVYDLVYNPRETRFLRMAEGRGAVIVDGIEMLIAQAAASYRQWTGTEMPLDVVRGALEGDGRS